MAQRTAWCLGCLLVLLLGARRTVATAEDAPAWAKVGPAQLRAAREAGVPVAFENALGMRFVLVPGGRFTMGWPKEGPSPWSAYPERSEAHAVTLSRPYYLQVTEMTVEQYRRAAPKEVLERLGAPAPERAKLPVTGVSFGDVGRVLAHLSTLDAERTYRLPTEAEWERACRGGKSSTWYWGKDAAKGVEYENARPAADSLSALEAVGSRKPNPYGLHDMLGNAYEWTRDVLAPLDGRKVEDPRGVGPVHPEVRHLFAGRVLRGGSYEKEVAQLTPYRRWAMPPGYVHPDVGFRAVVPVGEEPPAGFTSRLVLRTVDAPTGHGRTLSWSLGAREGLLGEQVTVTPVEGGAATIPHETPAKYGTLVRVDVPAGMRTWRDEWPGGAWIEWHPLPHAARVEATVPLYPTVRVSGFLDIPDDTSHDLCWVWLSALGDEPPAHRYRPPTPLVEPQPDGRFTIDLVPWIPGVPMRLASTHGFDRPGEGGTVLPPAYVPSLVLVPHVKRNYAGIPKPGPFHFGRGGDAERSPAKVDPWRRDDAGPQGGVALACADAAGTPLEGAVVVCDGGREEGVLLTAADVALVDDRGTASFPRLAAGRRTFRLYALGRAVAEAQVGVKPGETTRVDLRTPAPAQVRLTVRRAEGGPPAWAAVEVALEGGGPWYDLDPDRVLHAVPRLDHEGRATLHNLPPGTHTLTVTWLGRTWSEPVTVAAGETVERQGTLPGGEGWQAPAPR